MSTPLTAAQVAQRLGITRRAVAARVAAGTLSPSGKLPGITGAYLFDAEQIGALGTQDDAAPSELEGAAS